MRDAVTGVKNWICFVHPGGKPSREAGWLEQNSTTSEALLVLCLFSASLPSGHYLDVLFLLRQWSMLHQDVPGGEVSMLTEPLGQAIGALMQALQLLQLFPGHLNGGKRDTGVHGEVLSHCSPGFGPALPSPSCPPGTRCQPCGSRPCARGSAPGTAAGRWCPPRTSRRPAAPPDGSPACSRSQQSCRDTGTENRG